MREFKDGLLENQISEKLKINGHYRYEYYKNGFGGILFVNEDSDEFKIYEYSFNWVKSPAQHTIDTPENLKDYTITFKLIK